MMSILLVFLHLAIGLVTGYFYSQLFCYQKTDYKLKKHKAFGYQHFLFDYVTATILRLAILAITLCALLYWKKINLILIIVPFLVTFWITILKKEEVI